MLQYNSRKRAKTAAHTVHQRIAAQPFLRIGFLVHDVSRMRRTVFDQAVKPLGITRAQWWALANLSRHETEGMIQSDLARLLEVGKVTVGGLIDRLEGSGLVERRPDPIDRRIKRIFITDRGYDLINQMQTIARDLNAIILKGVPVDHVHIAEGVLHRMKENLREKLGPQAKDGGDPEEDERGGAASRSRPARSRPDKSPPRRR